MRFVWHWGVWNWPEVYRPFRERYLTYYRVGPLTIIDTRLD